MILSNNNTFKRTLYKLLGADREIRELERRIEELSWDATFGMWTKTAFLQFCRIMPRGRRVIAFVDMDRIHELNSRLGYTKVDRLIHDTFSIPFRKSDLVARWYSGDEIVILFDGDRIGAELKIGELRKSAEKNGLSFKYILGTWDVGTDPIEKVMEKLGEKARLEFEPSTRKKRQ